MLVVSGGREHHDQYVAMRKVQRVGNAREEGCKIASKPGKLRCAFAVEHHKERRSIKRRQVSMAPDRIVERRVLDDPGEDRKTTKRRPKYSLKNPANRRIDATRKLQPRNQRADCKDVSSQR